MNRFRLLLRLFQITNRKPGIFFNRENVGHLYNWFTYTIAEIKYTLKAAVVILLGKKCDDFWCTGEWILAAWHFTCGGYFEYPDAQSWQELSVCTSHWGYKQYDNSSV